MTIDLRYVAILIGWIGILALGAAVSRRALGAARWRRVLTVLALPIAISALISLFFALQLPTIHRTFACIPTFDCECPGGGVSPGCCPRLDEWTAQCHRAYDEAHPCQPPVCFRWP